MTANMPQAEFGVVDPRLATSVSGDDFLQGMLGGAYPSPPFAEVAKIWLSEVEPGRAVFEALPSARFYNPMGTVHGGWLTTLLDSAMACAVHALLRPGQAYTTVEMKVNFIRPVFEQTGLLRCEGKIVHMGGRLATSEGRITDGAGRLIGHGSETCMVFEISKPDPADRPETPSSALS